MEGIRIPPGSTLVNDSLLQTGDKPATLHLRGGQVLRLASHSSAHFEEAPAGAVRMEVRSGSATLRGTEAAALTAVSFLWLKGSRCHLGVSTRVNVPGNPPCCHV